MKTAKITACTFNNSFKSQFGTLYQHTITLSNGDTGQINAKEEMPESLAVGKELNYEITPNGKFPDKIKKVNPKFAAPTSQQDNNEIQELRNRIEKLEQVIKSIVTANKLVYVAKKPMPSPANVTTLNDDSDLPF